MLKDERHIARSSRYAIVMPCHSKLLTHNRLLAHRLGDAHAHLLFASQNRDDQLLALGRLTPAPFEIIIAELA